MAHNNQVQSRFTGKHMLLLMLAFFGVIVAVNFTMAFLASHSWTGLVVKNSYVASQNFNDELAAARKQRASGIQSDLAYTGGKLKFVLKDRNGTQLSATEVKAEIGRPAFEQADRAIVLQPGLDGAHKAEIELAPGVWAVKLSANVKGQSYRRDARLFVDPDGKGRVE